LQLVCKVCEKGTVQFVTSKDQISMLSQTGRENNLN
jgi:hypothetical protein